MKIAVTGASGQLGQLVLEKLKEKTNPGNIVALVRNAAKKNIPDVETREFDYNKAETLETPLSGIDKLLLISGSEIGSRVAQHTNIIEAAVKAGVKTIVYTSLLRADNSSLSLAAEHIETENILKKSGVTYTLLRHGWYTENFTSAIPAAIELGTLYNCAGDAKLSPATREDFAECAANVLLSDGHDNQTYELAGDETFTLADFAKELSNQLDKNIPYVDLTEDDYTKALIKAGLPEGIAAFLAGSSTSMKTGALYDDTHQLSKILGRPTTSLAKAISAAIKITT